MIPLDIFADPVCPWCLIGKVELDRALESRPLHPFQVTWHSFRLNPQMPRGGIDRIEYLRVKLGDRADEASRAVAQRALERRTGARGLRSIMEETLMPLMYSVPSDPTIVRVTITEACVTDGAEAQLTRDPERQLSAENNGAKKRSRKTSAT